MDGSKLKGFSLRLWYLWRYYIFIVTKGYRYAMIIENLSKVPPYR